MTEATAKLIHATDQPPALTRRQLVKAGAWAAPAVVVAVAAPAASASATVTPQGLPGVTGSGKSRTVIISTSVAGNTAAPTATLTWTQGTRSGTASAAVTGSYTFTFSFNLHDNSGGATAEVTFYQGTAVIGSISSFAL
jgi:hypothetical protein